MQTDFENHLLKTFPFINGKSILLAISGGIDSVVLGFLCQHIGLNFALAHCNFSLRGTESEEDEFFVKNLAKKWGREFFIKKFETAKIAAEKKCSIQVTARELRYEWFQKLVKERKFDYIFTAHQADDNLETYLINTIRGTGLEGLTGIPEINGIIVRPLLPFSRMEIESYAKANGIFWREDSSNASSKYLRNKIRHEVIPVLKTENPFLLRSFSRTQQHLKEASDLIADYRKLLFEDIVEKKSDELHFDIQKIEEKPSPKAVLYYLLKDFGFTAWEDIFSLLSAQTGKMIFSPTHRLLKNRRFLILSTNRSKETNNNGILIEDFQDVDFPLGELGFKIVPRFEKTGMNQIFVEKNAIKFPLKLRKWKESDYFYPFGMKGKKKLSSFLKDEKFSMFAKEKIWVLTSEEKIVWVVGHRADERFRVHSENTDVLKIRLVPKPEFSH